MCSRVRSICNEDSSLDIVLGRRKQRKPLRNHRVRAINRSKPARYVRYLGSLKLPNIFKNIRKRVFKVLNWKYYCLCILKPLDERTMPKLRFSWAENTRENRSRRGAYSIGFTELSNIFKNIRKRVFKVLNWKYYCLCILKPLDERTVPKLRFSWAEKTRENQEILESAINRSPARCV